MLLIKFPSKSRPSKLLYAYEKYISLAKNPSRIKTIISLDSDDLSVTPELCEKLININSQTQICVGEPMGKIGAVNRDMEYAGDYDILLLASDDMIPEYHGYDELIRQKMTEHYPDTDGVLWFNDGFQKDKLNTLCILGKNYYERFGYIYHPSYKTAYCDNEFMDVANSLKKQIYFDTVIIRHHHPDWIPQSTDLLFHSNNKFIGIDRNNYFKRKALGFN